MDLGVPYEAILKKAIERGYAGNQTEVIRQALVAFERLIDEEESRLVNKGIGLEMQEKTFIELWEELYPKYKAQGEIVRNENNHEAFHLSDEDKIFTLGYTDGKPVLSRILSMNRQPFEGKIVDINTGGKTVSLTPEHSVYTSRGDVEAGKLSTSSKIIKLMEELLAIRR